MSPLDSKRLVFVGGLHRSGTTALGRILANHPDISGFQGTDAEEDEGQHLQDVYPPAKKYGGPGRFARNRAAHLTENSELDLFASAGRLEEHWSPHWDAKARFLVEKSPPNMIMGRWLQAVFPGSCLIVIVRHPVVVSLSTKKWTRRTSLHSLMRHWFTAHKILERDAAQLSRLLVVRYEDLVADPRETLKRVAWFVGLDTPLSHERLEATRSSRYVDRWLHMQEGTRLEKRQRDRIIRDFSAPTSRWGYDIHDLTAHEAFAWPPSS